MSHVAIILVFVSSLLTTNAAEALSCPEKLEVEIHGMEFSEPGSAFSYENQYGNISVSALQYHQAVEAQVIEGAKRVLPEGFQLTSVGETCEYIGGGDTRVTASIYVEKQYVEPELNGHPVLGSETLRLLIRVPVFLAHIDDGAAHLRRYLTASMNFYIWLKRSGKDQVAATAFDEVAAMLKYQVDDFFGHLFFYPLGLSDLGQVEVRSGDPSAVSALHQH